MLNQIQTVNHQYTSKWICKNYLQILVIDKDEQILHNSKINNDGESIDDFFDDLAVMQKWSWGHQVSGMTFTASKKRGFDVVLSNPIKTKSIASTKNTLLFIKKQQGFG